MNTRKKSIQFVAITATFAAITAAYVISIFSPKPIRAAEDSAPAPTCVAPASWFPQSQTPKPDPNIDFDSRCKFHQWAWQSFLWMTQEVDKKGTLRFETFPTEADVLAGRTKPDGTLRLVPRTSKNDRAESLASINQAGESGVLVDQNGRAVYYSQHYNPQMAKEVIERKWNIPKVLTALSVNYPNTEFSVGDVELKASWKIVSEGDDTSTLFVREAQIDELVDVNGAIKLNPKKQITIKVALVGLHIVGWVNGHPEAIWSTFEHVNNAPDYGFEQNANDAVSDQDYTFYKANTKAVDCNQLNSARLTLDQKKQTLSPVTQVARVFPFGFPAGSTNPNITIIKDLNASVWKQLAKGNIWKNYMEGGAIWTHGTNQFGPNKTFQDQLLGCTTLSNTVIETFTQNLASQHNCFSCHNTLMYSPSNLALDPLRGTNLNLSHLILDAYNPEEQSPLKKKRGSQKSSK